MHSTDNLEDGYIGSGKRLWHSINKYGKDNHIKEILEFLPDRESLKAREKEIVNEEMLNEELCMNLAIGGSGGFSNEEHKQKFLEGRIWGKVLGGIKAQELLKHNPEKRKNIIEKTRFSMKEFFKSNPGNFTGKTHTKETIAKMQESKKGQGIGENNSQYGKCWITNEIESKKIYKGDTIPEGWRLGRIINKN